MTDAPTDVQPYRPMQRKKMIIKSLLPLSVLPAPGVQTRGQRQRRRPGRFARGAGRGGGGGEEERRGLRTLGFCFPSPGNQQGNQRTEQAIQRQKPYHDLAEFCRLRLSVHLVRPLRSSCSRAAGAGLLPRDARILGLGLASLVPRKSFISSAIIVSLGLSVGRLLARLPACLLACLFGRSCGLSDVYFVRLIF